MFYTEKLNVFAHRPLKKEETVHPQLCFFIASFKKDS